MTREEAIEILKAHHMWTGEPQEIIDVRKENKALDMAILALSQEPICDRDCEHCTWTECPREPCDDAVSRDAVMRLIENKPYDWSNLTERHNMLMEIRKLPSVTHKSKTGHWIKKEDDTCWWYVCSECEQEPLKNRWNDDDVLSSFCPNCGAKMVEPQESEE